MTQVHTYAIDIVLCIDASHSMSSILNRVKSGALRLYDDITDKMTGKDKVVDALRVRVIAFRDFWSEGPEALTASKFFSLPADQQEFCTFISTIHASGGGDEPENGLEALSLAIKSDWPPVRNAAGKSSSFSRMRPHTRSKKTRSRSHTPSTCRKVSTNSPICTRIVRVT